MEDEGHMLLTLLTCFRGCDIVYLDFLLRVSGG